MCGRVGVREDVKRIIGEILAAAWEPEAPFTPNNNVNPTDDVPGVRLTENGRVASNYLWGFLPPDAQDRKFVGKYHSFNARADTIATSRMYGGPFRSQRSLVVVSAWFEWPKLRGEKKGGPPKTIEPTSGGVFVFAGLWGPWTDPETKASQDTATVITTEPNTTISKLPHHRMPSILPEAAWEEWLHPDTGLSTLQDMLHPTPDEWLKVVASGPAAFHV